MSAATRAWLLLGCLLLGGLYLRPARDVLAGAPTAALSAARHEARAARAPHDAGAPAEVDETLVASRD